MRTEFLQALVTMPDAAFRIMAAALDLSDSKGRAPAGWRWWAERVWNPPAQEKVVRDALRYLSDKNEVIAYRVEDGWLAVFPRVTLERQGKQPISRLVPPPREKLAGLFPEAVIDELVDSQSWTARERSVAAQTGTRPAHAKAQHVRSDDVLKVFATWCQVAEIDTGRVFGSTGRLKDTEANKKREVLVRRRLLEYDLDFVIRAVQGFKFSAHHMGQNDRGTEYKDLMYVLRHPEKMEGFARMFERNIGSAPRLEDVVKGRDHEGTAV
jgi:hypothetical protein